MATSSNKPSAPGADAKAGAKPDARALSASQRAYEERRAAKAGMSLEKWLTAKERERSMAARAEAPAAPAKPVGKARAFVSRLLERANKPLR